MLRSRFLSVRAFNCSGLFAVYVLALLLTSCGGGSGSAGGGGGGTGGVGSTTVTSGEYLWEVGGATNTLAYATINTTTGALSSPTVAGGPASNPTNLPSIVVSPSGIFLCAFYGSLSQLVTFEMTGPGLQLSSGGETLSIPYELSMTMHPSGKFIYVFTSGVKSSIQEISVNSGGGTVLGPAVEESASLSLGVFDPAGQYLFVNDATDGGIFVFQVNQTNGSLTAVANSPFALPSGEQPTYLAIGGSGTSLFLYADLYTQTALGGGIAAFSIDSSTGALAVVPGSPFQTGADAAPVYISVDPSRNFLYASSFYGAIYGFHINPTTGALSQVPGSPVSTASGSDTIAIDPSDQFLYVTNYSNSTISGFSINATTGSLSPLSGSPFPAVAQPEGLTMMAIQ